MNPTLNEFIFQLQEQYVDKHATSRVDVEACIDEFMMRYNRGDFNDTVEIKKYDLFEEIGQTSSPTKLRNLYKKILVLDPEDMDAKRGIIRLIEHNGQQIMELETLLNSVKKPKKLDWGYTDARPYMRALIELASYYIDAGLYKDAINAFVPVFHGDKQDRSRYLLLMMLACCSGADWNHGRKVFSRYQSISDDITNMLNGRPDVTLPMYMLYIILAIQCGEMKEARAALDELLDEYEDMDWFLADALRWNDLLEDTMYILMHIADHEEDLYTDPAEVMTMVGLIQQLPAHLVYTDSVLWQKLFDLYGSITGESTHNRYRTESYVELYESRNRKRSTSSAKQKSAKSTSGSASTAKSASKSTSSAKSAKIPPADSPLYEGLTTCQKRSLTEANLITVDDFAKVTQQDVLALHRVGAKAIDTLINNGVKFKG